MMKFETLYLFLLSPFLRRIRPIPKPKIMEEEEPDFESEENLEALGYPSSAVMDNEDLEEM